MSPGMDTTVAHASAHDINQPMFRSIPVEKIKSDYLPSLVTTLPWSMSQLGLAMTTLYAHEHHHQRTHVQDKDSITAALREPDQHLRSIPFLSKLQGHEADPPTVYDLTMARPARICYINASSEDRLAAVLAAYGEDYAKAENEEGEQSWQEREAKIRADPFIQEQFQIFQTVAREIVRIINDGVDADTAKEPVHFFGVNRIWYRAVVSLYPMHRDGPSIKFGITEKDLLAIEPQMHAEMKEIADRNQWTVVPMQKLDIPQLIERNSIKYDEEYAEHVIERSVCFRDQTGAMIAWAGTHQDLAVAALHVLPEYRKEGLGRLMLYYINLMQIKRLREYLAGTSQASVDPSLLYMHADTEASNVPTQKFMLRCGYKILSYANWFTLTPIEKTETA